MNETGTYPTGKTRTFNPSTGTVEWNGDVEANHVWHCSLSLSPEEAALGDEVWGRIASDFMDEMGFTGSDGKAPCRWVAIHHGSAKNGGDHIHIAANIVREDGTKWSPWYDQKRAQRACNTLEHRYGLLVVESREHARGSRCDSAAAQNAAKRAGASRTDRAVLEERLRAAATAAANEADFVRRARRLGVRLHPRFASGRTDIVVGYSAALRTEDGQQTRWWGGGRIARDLTLTQLRTRWEDTPTSALEAVEAWKGHYPKKAPYDGPLWEDRIRALEHFRTHLDRLSPTDHLGLATAAADIAGLLHAQAITARTTGGRDMLERAAVQVGRCAQLKTRPADKRLVDVGARIASDLALSIAAATNPRMAAVALAHATADLVQAIADLHGAAGQGATAAAIERDAQAMFDRVNTYPRVDVDALASAYERLERASAPAQREAVPLPPPPPAPREDSAIVRDAQALANASADDALHRVRAVLDAAGMPLESPRPHDARPGIPRDVLGGQPRTFKPAAISTDEAQRLAAEAAQRAQHKDNGPTR
ncbi:relaxase/mobilization nuclease domain-containing protein [uncultured Actinomyces sp.]|uniref:relaxase/mobilization nuclease domain-containing protein n=1 Tax=uncultured Actinomyces sp. TaxID=249061 RepID=UPI00262F1512|nr:relaxase/mobilization nuclease domain-containing protein [uncultured Actinomyces sp.]